MMISDNYQDFANDMMAFLKLKWRSHPDLKPFLDSVERIAQEILQDYGRTEERMKTSDYVNDLARKTKALTQQKDQQNLPTFLDLGERWRGIGGAQDSLVERLHRMIRNSFQEAGYGCVNYPEVIDVAEEIRRRCRECLRNPYGYEVWPDY